MKMSWTPSSGAQPEKRKILNNNTGVLPAAPSASLCRLSAILPVTEHGVHKVHVGIHRRLRYRPTGLLDALLLIGQLLGHLLSILSLSTEVIEDPVEELLGQLGTVLLGHLTTR
jgi:hypothetical protein